MDVIFKFVFAIITLTVSLYSFKVYKLSGQESSKLFGQAFMFFSISYFLQSLLNFAIISKLSENICTVVKIQSVATFSLLGTYFHMLFFITGLVTLTYMTLKVKNTKLYTLLLVISLVSLAISMNKIYWFFLLSSILLLFIVFHYASNCSKKFELKKILVLFAFVLLFLSQIHFIFSVNHTIYYVIGHYLELSAYVLILINLLLVLRKK